MHHGCRTAGCDAQHGDVFVKACMLGALWLARSLQHFTGVRGFRIRTQHCCTSLQRSRDPLFAFYTDFAEVNKNGNVHYLHKPYMPDHPCCTNSPGVMQRQGGSFGGEKTVLNAALTGGVVHGSSAVVAEQGSVQVGVCLLQGHAQVEEMVALLVHQHLQKVVDFLGAGRAVLVQLEPIELAEGARNYQQLDDPVRICYGLQ